MPIELKATLMRTIVAAGFEQIEAVALVHPAAMPHMADAELLLETVGPVPRVNVSALTLNERGLERAKALRARDLLDEVHFLHATTAAVLAANGFRDGIDANRNRVIAMARSAKEDGLRTLAYISASFGCSIEGYVPAGVPMQIAESFAASGVVDEITFSDSTGQATPRQVWEFFVEVRSRLELPVTAHLHDSRGSGLANVFALLQANVENLTIDCAFGGLGGDVPFLPEAAGNICTEDLISMLEGCSVETGVRLGKVLDAARAARDFYSDPVPSHVLQIGPRSWTPPRESPSHVA